jgi:hypothetical protein
MRPWLALFALAGCPKGDDTVDTSDPDDTSDTEDSDTEDSDTEDSDSDDTDTEPALDLSGWWVADGTMTEASGACGYTGVRPTARRFAADGTSVTTADVFQPTPAPSTTTTCTVDGAALTCVRETDGASGSGTAHSVVTTVYDVDGDGISAAATIAQTCATGTCDALCNTEITYALRRATPPDPTACAAPTYPTPATGTAVTLTGGVYVDTHDVPLRSRTTSDDHTVTDGAGGAASWIDADTYTVTAAAGGGEVHVAPDLPELMPTTLRVATWADLNVMVPVYDRRTLDAALLGQSHHPTDAAFGHLVVSFYERGSGGSVTSSGNVNEPPSVGAPATMIGVDGVAAEFYYTNLCPGTRTVSLPDYEGVGACVVMSGSDSQSATSVAVPIRAGEVTRVTLYCPLTL